MERISREILCGIDYQQIVACAGMSQKAAAKRLGINHAYFNRTLHRIGASHWFEKPKQVFSQCVTPEDIAKVAAEGYTQKDAAFVLEVSERYFKSLVARWQLNNLFPNSGKAALISRRGYTGPNTEGHGEE